MERLRNEDRLQSPEYRRMKARKILAVMRAAAAVRGKELRGLTALDVGCSNGLITGALAAHFRRVVGIDTDREAVQAAAQMAERIANLEVVAGSAMRLPFGDGSFDVVCCNHVYEHVPSAESLMNEVARVLRDNGFCYFAAGNKYKVMEAHYRLPFLSWLPRRLANAYVRMFRGVDRYEEQHYSWWQIKRLLQRFDVTDYTLELIKDPARFEMTDLVRPTSLASRLPRPVLRMLEPAIPTYVFILGKRSNRPSSQPAGDRDRPPARRTSED